jgi:hypothetical protein
MTSMNDPATGAARGVYTYRAPAEREDALRDAVRGLAPDADEERILAWLSRWEAPTVATITNLFDKVRVAGMLERLDVENAFRRQRHASHHAPDARGIRNPGNSGPGW